MLVRIQKTSIFEQGNLSVPDMPHARAFFHCARLAKYSGSFASSANATEELLCFPTNNCD